MIAASRSGCGGSLGGVLDQALRDAVLVQAVGANAVRANASQAVSSKTRGRAVSGGCGIRVATLGGTRGENDHGYDESQTLHLFRSPEVVLWGTPTRERLGWRESARRMYP